MFKRVKAYTIVCNNCGDELETDLGENLWYTEEDAEDYAIDAGWLVDTEHGKHYCPCCQEWDEKQDAYVPRVNNQLNNRKQ